MEATRRVVHAPSLVSGGSATGGVGGGYFWDSLVEPERC